MRGIGWPWSIFRPWTVVHGGQERELAQNIHANKGWCDMHANQLSQTTCSSEYSNGQAAVWQHKYQNLLYLQIALLPLMQLQILLMAFV